jgi:multiple sugar transport system ATP-binding protein
VSEVRLDGITKSFDDLIALDDLSLEIRDGEFFVLLGPTGAGKTTTLRVVAGLERQEVGDVHFDGELMNGVPPADRDTAFVFQQYSLYPGMSVYDNLAFPLKAPLRRLSKPEIDQRIAEAAEMLHIGHLLERKTANLSGGEMQRVSIGRAIVRNPRIYLMDEPLSNLDAKLRETLRVELKHLQKTQGVTTLFVTHDQIEALTMADRLAVVDRGRIVQVGSPEDIYDRPATTYVAQLVGTPRINLFDATRSDGTLSVAGSALTLPAPAGAELPEQLLVGLRPEDITLHPEGEHRGRVVLTEPLGVETVVHLQSGDRVLLCTVSGISRLDMGDEVAFSVADQRLLAFGQDGVRIAGGEA